MKSKKLVAILLVLVMTFSFSVAGVQAFAEEWKGDADRFNNNDTTGYVAFGDSITRGYGALPDWDEWNAIGYNMDYYDENDANPQYLNCRNVKNSYPWLVANALGCQSDNNILDKTAKYWPISQDAMTTAFLIDLLGIEDDYCDLEYVYGQPRIRERYATALHYFGDENSVALDGNGKYTGKAVSLEIGKMIENASLISLAVGMGDVLNRPRTLVADDFLENGDLSDTKALLGVVADMVAKMYEGFEYWKENYPLLLDYFKENMSEDAELVIIGALNPVFNMNITDEYLIPIGTALSAITAMMNNQYKQWANKYGFIYVDISNVETGSTEGSVGVTDFLKMKGFDQGKATHPTPTGYQQIADMIVSALNERAGLDKTAKTDIKINLGRITSVTDVRVNGHSVRNYELNGNVLTVHYGCIGAKTLTVTSIGEDGKMAMTNYKLSYNNGYSAYRIYTTNDFGSVFSSLFSNIFKLFSKVFDIFSK